MRDDRQSPRQEEKQRQTTESPVQSIDPRHSPTEATDGAGHGAVASDGSPTQLPSEPPATPQAAAGSSSSGNEDEKATPPSPMSLEMSDVTAPTRTGCEGDPDLITTRLDSSDPEPMKKTRVEVPVIDLKSTAATVEKSAISERRGQSMFGGGRPPSARIYPVLNDSQTGINAQEGSFHNAGRVSNALAKRLDSSSDAAQRKTSSYLTVTKTLTLRTLQVSARASFSAAGNQPEQLDPVRHRLIFMRTQKSLAEIFVKPTESHWRRRVNQFIFIWILLSISAMAFETCDGPNFGSSAPNYPALPTEAVYRMLDTVSTAVFSAEFVGRILANKFSRRILKHPLTWIDLVALAPWYARQAALSSGYELNVTGWSGTGHQFALVRLIRTLRLAHILRHYEQSKILFLSIKASLPPLAIILFFLFTLVMVLATALFYAEPCYNVNTCTFTDIFNSAYFIMITVATVGYGSQVPSLKNAGALLITCIAMILGQIYFSMPVAIIGNNFDRTYESFQMNKKQKMNYFDSSLSPFDCLSIHAKVKRLCDIQYHTLNAWQVVLLNINQSRRIGRAFTQIKATEDMVESQRAHHAKMMEAIERLIEVHSEACKLIQSFIPHKMKVRRSTMEPQSKGILNDIYARARKVMAQAKFPIHRYSGHMDTRLLSQTAKGRLWLLLEVPDSSFTAMSVNKLMVIFALMSIMLFYLESLQELAASGVETSACRKVVSEYCSSGGFAHMDPGCFLRRNDSTTDFSTALDFGCASVLEASNCYGAGVNFGSLNESALDCNDSFLDSGVSIICYRQQCFSVATTVIDMSPYWIYFEWFFGTVFTCELILRFYVCQSRRHFLKDFYIAFDVLAVVPFMVEVLQVISGGSRPDYAIVATSPSFLSVVRVLKIMRILKLTRHFRATKVIASTAKRVWERLLIPLFFLFSGAFITGALFYEIERGTECFVGRECMWWGRNILRPWLEAGLPVGERVLIQATRPTIITDMIHSSWLSYTTLTSVGYGDLVSRTSLGKGFSIIVIMLVTIYSAMPLSLVGSQFYTLYEKYLEKSVIKRGGSSQSWRTKRSLPIESESAAKRMEDEVAGAGLTQKNLVFRLTQDELEVVHQFEGVKRTIANLQRSLENVMHVSLDIRHQNQSHTSFKERMAGNARSTDMLDQVIETKANAVLDTLLQFSLVVERLHDAPVGYEAFIEHDHSLGTIASSHALSPRGISQYMGGGAVPSIEPTPEA